MRNDVTQAVVEAFPDETEFIVMAKPDWEALRRHLQIVGLPAHLLNLHVLTLELEP